MGLGAAAGVAFGALMASGWALAYGRAHRSLSALTALREAAPWPPARWPAVSVVVAACDEEAAIEAAARSLLAQDYPHLEVVVVNDRSTDRTGALLDALAAEDPRLRVLHVDQLPAGWLGKVHALHLGLGCAQEGADPLEGWVLLTDADVHFAPDALRRAVALAEQRTLDHFTLIPQVHASGPLLKAMQVWFGLHLVVLNRVEQVHDPASPAFLGAGAFNLVRRRALAALGGLEPLRLEVLDDLGLGYLLKRRGFRSDAALGHGLVSLTWYQDVADMVRGVEKNAFAAFAGYDLARLGAVVLGILAVDLLGPLTWLAVGLRGPGWGWALALALVGVLPLVRALRTYARRTGNPAWVGVLFPAAALVLAWAGLRSAWTTTVQGGVRWRGRRRKRERGW